MIEIPLPSAALTEQTIGYLSNNVIIFSSQTKAFQSIKKPGTLLVQTLTWKTFNVESRDLAAFLWALEGSANFVRIPDFAHPRPSGSLAGAPLVNLAGQTGYSLAIKNCQPAATLRAGDWIGLQDNCFRVFKDSAADASGGMVVQLTQPLVNSPANNELVLWDRPAAKYVCTTAISLDMLRGGNVGEVTLDFVQIL